MWGTFHIMSPTEKSWGTCPLRPPRVAPLAKDKIVCKHFPNFSMGGQPLQFVTEFRYLGHIISNNTG